MKLRTKLADSRTFALELADIRCGRKSLIYASVFDPKPTKDGAVSLSSFTGKSGQGVGRDRLLLATPSGGEVFWI
jgi:hypothetical protein